MQRVGARRCPCRSRRPTSEQQPGGAQGHRGAAAAPTGTPAWPLLTPPPLPSPRRLRVSLGLKPLKLEAEAPKGPSAEALAAKAAEDAAAKAEALAERVKL